jgi:hypothetical protein
MDNEKNSNGEDSVSGAKISDREEIKSEEVEKGEHQSQEGGTEGEGSQRIEKVEPGAAEVKAVGTASKKSEVRGLKIALFVMIGVIVLGAGGVVGLLLMNSGGDKQEEIAQEDEAPEYIAPDYEGEKAVSDHKLVRWVSEEYTPKKAFLAGTTGKNGSKVLGMEYRVIAKLSGEAFVVTSSFKVDTDYDLISYECRFIVDGDAVTLVGSDWCFDAEYLKWADFVKKEEMAIDGMVPTSIIRHEGVEFKPTFGFWSNLKLSMYGSIDKKEIADGLFEITSGKGGAYYARQFAVVMPDGSVYPYTLDSDLREYTEYTITYGRILVGCGTLDFYFSHVLNFEPRKDLMESAGWSAYGEVYRLKSGELVDELYDGYINSLGAYDEPLSPAEFRQKPTHVIYKDAKGEWILLVNPFYAMTSGCGKPVVYLYPAREMIVDVFVGANVKISEPEYMGGWRGVVAKPNGELSYNGKQYDSLYWEGTGDGLYPGVRGVGTVVPQKEAAATIKRQLWEQGLNSKEIADFMEFWGEKVPKTPYVKLTWLTKEQIDVLAPLLVYPRPDTVIRVFLDMQGLQKPVKVESRVLKPTERKGFTVVEWGGLIRERG